MTIPLTTMIIIITIRSAHIGFEEAGIDDDTSVENMAYESKMVIARPTRSPDSTGSKNTSLYYGVMIIAPTVLFALMNPLVFLLPVESGERVGLAMTILLSYAIFLTLVSSSIPASSNPMCALLIVSSNNVQSECGLK
jgi:hypothetical protein